MHSLIQDFRYGLRLIRRWKGLALGVVVSMALGVGATASVFSLVDSFIFRPLPVPETSRVVRIANSTAANSVGRFSYPEYRDYMERSQSFSGIVTYQNAIIGLAAKPGDQPRVTLGMLVSGNFFSTLQVRPVVGRGFLPEEDSVPGRDAVAVISYMAWQHDFAGAADVSGRTVEVNGHAFTIVGVAPKDFPGVDPFVMPDIYIPRMMIQQAYSRPDVSDLTNRSGRSAGLVARLKPGVTVEQANGEAGRIAAQLEIEHPETNKGVKAVVLTQAGYRIADAPEDLMLGVVLLSIAFLVLGIACVNVANLLLSTSPARTREMALRVAMGAHRMRLLRQLLLESALLSSVGTLAGLAIASWCAEFFSSIPIASDLPVRLQVQVDSRVVIFSIGVGFLSALLSGAVPAWRCSRSDLNSLLKSSDPRNRTHRTWGRQTLVGAQVAVTALVLVFSGLFLKDFRITSTRNPGFRLENVLTMSFDPSMAQYDLAKTRAFYTELVERVRAMRSVKSAAVGQHVPLGVTSSGTDLTIEGYEMPPNQQSINVRSSMVGDGYFDTLDIPIVRGRAFDRRDGASSPRAVIVNETMAQQYWPARDAIGARVDIKGEGGGPAQVIGIARNSKYKGVDERPTPFLYRSYTQATSTEMVLFVETDGDPAAFASPVRAEVRNIAPNMPIFDVRTMHDHYYDHGLLGPRLIAQVMTAVGAVGLILGILGLYGVIAYSVGQRTYEIGIRMALGASNRQVLRMVLLQGLKLCGIAMAIGIVLALGLSAMIKDIVSYVNPRDPAIYAGVILLLLAVTGAACYLPARRASMVDPNTTLRQ
jgi:putative ABC transport system permease protein